MTHPTTPTTCLQLSLLTLALLSSPAVLADANAAWYFGASAGPTQARIDDARILQSLGNRGLSPATISDNDRDTAYKFFGGYQVNRFLALEGSYFDLGSYSFVAQTTPTGTLSGETRLRGLGLDAVLSAPLTDKFSLFAKAGVNYTQARDRFSASGAVTVLDTNPSKTELNPKIGIGMQYAVTDALALRAELERYRINDAVGSRGDVDHLTIGLVYTWGKTRAAMPVHEPVTQATPVAQGLPVLAEPMAATAAPAPTPPPTPEPPPIPSPAPAPKPVVLIAPIPVTLSADSLFAFDKSTLSADGKQQLDAFSAQLKTLNYEFITVTGHTDRLGEHVYNVRLSERRAQVVGNYLTQVAGIPAAKVLARGQNGANAITKPGDCVGSKATKALIACLQPDRRVDLAVSGTR